MTDIIYYLIVELVSYDPTILQNNLFFILET